MNNERWFLGGTCAETTWRDELIPMLETAKIEYFNPVVKDWTPECQAIEEDEKNNKCNVHLYMITPEMQGVYSIAEIINSCWQAIVYGTTVNKVYFYVLDPNDQFTKGQLKSLNATIRLCKDIAGDRFKGRVIKSVQEFMNEVVFIYL
jgi:hypothetical protein